LAALFLLAMLCVLIGTGLTAVTLAARAFWNDVADQVDMIMLGHSPLRRLLMGIINAFGLFIIAVVLLNLGPLRLIGLALIFTLVILTLIGLMSEMAQIGRRVLALRSAQSSIFAQTVTGGMTITL